VHDGNIVLARDREQLEAASIVSRDGDHGRADDDP
jgi:hypothetical protein